MPVDKKRFRCTILSLAMLISSMVFADKKVSIKDLESFEAFKSTLSVIVHKWQPDTDKPQHFYVAKYNSNDTVTYMFWQEMKLLWIFFPDDRAKSDWYGIQFPSGGQLLDLTRDVVATAEEIGGSTYLVSKDWASEKLFETVIDGDLIIVEAE